MLHNVVVIFETRPESIAVYNLEVTKDTYDVLVSANGVYGNASGNSQQDEEIIDWVSKFLLDKTPDLDDESTTLPLVTSGPVTIILCGFLM